MTDSQILIVGAGPTGLALALFLAKAGVRPRIIAKTAGPGLESRAMVVQARSLEFYRQLGFAGDVVRKGIPINDIAIREDGRIISKIDIDELGAGISPYPFVLSFPQDDHEKLLVQQLEAAGVKVEWETTLLEMHESDDRVYVTLVKHDGTQEQCTADYLCGCDGAHSTVRHDAELGFAGESSGKTFFVADVQATGDATADKTFTFCLGSREFLLVLPVRSSGTNRLIGALPDEIAGRENITFDDIRPAAESAADIHVDTVNWFSTYRVSHRVADHFHNGRVFILGDAGHIHSPVGGQGMNTGIGDAVNLSWKLASVVQGRADKSLLDTYEPERIAFARTLVATTDKLFQVMAGSSRGSQFMRETVFPHLMPFLLGFSGTRGAAFRLLSQVHINYHGSALSEGEAGEMHGGDRLPWVPLGDSMDNFAPLTSFDWQVHVYGKATQALRERVSDAGLTLHTFDWIDQMRHAGLKQDALYLIRPDGYVALADASQDSVKLTAFLSKFKLVPAKPGPETRHKAIPQAQPTAGPQAQASK